MFIVSKFNRHRQYIFILCLYLQFTLSTERKNLRNVIFEVMINPKIFERLDLSNEDWSQFNVRDTSTEKQVDLYEIESIDNPNIVTIAVNPKNISKNMEIKVSIKNAKDYKRIPQERTLRSMQIE